MEAHLGSCQQSCQSWNFYKSNHRRCSIKKLFLKISQNSQENTCARVSFLVKLESTLLKKRLWHWCFPVNFAKFFRTPFLRNTSALLLLLLALDYFPKKINLRCLTYFSPMFHFYTQ